jgi:hypothetical protein
MCKKVEMETECEPSIAKKRALGMERCLVWRMTVKWLQVGIQVRKTFKEDEFIIVTLDFLHEMGQR